MRVALIHYWLVGMRGGEKVLEELCALYPQADIYTHVMRPEALSNVLRAHRIQETFIARIPGARRHYQKLLPLMPMALEALDLSGYDLVISSEAGPAKGVITDPDCLHLCYCHSPMRYIWDQSHIYRGNAGRITRALMPMLSHRLRQWDMASASRVDHIIANSHFVARRIAKAWGRQADVIHPPVALSQFAPAPPPSTTAPYLWAGELVDYKRPEQVIGVFTRSGRPLVVLGDGRARARLQAQAGPNVQFLGRVSDETLRHTYHACRALVFTGVEDFGILPLELMASGRPVVALGRGGLAETVRDGHTGILFDEPTDEALETALRRFEAQPAFDPQVLRAHAEQFSPARFRAEFAAQVEARLHQRDIPPPAGKATAA